MKDFRNGGFSGSSSPDFGVIIKGGYEYSAVEEAAHLREGRYEINPWFSSLRVRTVSPFPEKDSY